MKMECQGCTRRTVEPNCHNEQTCEFWARHMAERRKAYSEREVARKNARPETRYIKNTIQKGGMYIRGEKRPTVPKGCTLVKRGARECGS